MRSLYCRFAFLVIIPALIILLSGCAIGIKPRSHDVPPEDDAYYEESGYGSYYGSYSRSGGYSRYNSSYDPWTMDTYYQHYSSTPRSGSGGSSTSSAKSEVKRPTAKDRDSTSVSQSETPAGSEGSNPKGSRSSTRERRKPNSQVGNSRSRRARTDTNRRTSRVSQEGRSTTKRRRTETRRTSQTPRPEQAGSTTEDEDEKNKKRRSR